MTLTQIIILSLAALTLVIDLILVLWRGKDATISRTLLLASQRWPVIAFLAGFVAGHIFWRNE